MKPTLGPENRKIINKALRAMLAMPETYNQLWYIEHNSHARPTRRRPAPYCGTVACVAGHIALAAGLPPTATNHEIRRCAVGIVGYAGGDRLFSPILRDWPLQFRSGWDRLTRAEKAARAVARVRHWMRTGE